MVSNEHPEALERLLPDGDLETKVKIAAKKLREAKKECDILFMLNRDLYNSIEYCSY